MLNRRHVFQIAGLAALAVTTGCAPSPGLTPGPGAPAQDLAGMTTLRKLPFETVAGTSDAALASTRIGWRVMQDSAVPGENLALSPSSLASALAMVAEGAAGDSLSSLDDAFGLTGDARSEAMGALRQSLSVYKDLPASVSVDDPPENPIVHQANRVLVLGDKQVEHDFLDRLSSFHDSQASRTPLTAAKADLDAWAVKHTAGLIEESAIIPDASTLLVIQDALVFAARWQHEFTEEDVPLSFRTDDGTDVPATALREELLVPYAEGDGWAAVRLAYDDQLAMDVVLPEAGALPLDLTLEALEASRTALDAATPRSALVTMPPLDLTSKVFLLAPLDAQGITLENLSRIAPGAFADQAVQQVVLQVSAKGTVGAALTEIAVSEARIESPDDLVEFTVDHPYLLRVLDVRTGWPLFLAVVNQPTGPAPV